MTIKVFTDPTITDDAYLTMRVGDTRQEVLDEHLFVVTATEEHGRDTGRCRYRVVCRSCRVVVHPATTGPQWKMRSHIQWFTEDGHPTPFPGTEIGVES